MSIQPVIARAARQSSADSPGLLRHPMSGDDRLNSDVLRFECAALGDGLLSPAAKRTRDETGEMAHQRLPG
ncbi:MAG: hypothetical protein Kow0063_21240 [Anaerolineae bacterium]